VLNLLTFFAAGVHHFQESGYTEAGVMWQMIIHVVFILSAMGIAWTDYLMSKTLKGH
jgi:uncharacterized membrane protein YqhA